MRSRERSPSSPWPWIAWAIVGVLALWAITQASPATTSDGGGTVSQVVAAPGVLTVVVYLSERPTQTPDVRIVTATPTATPTPEQLPICEQAPLGAICVQMPPMMTATNTPDVPWCGQVTPSVFGYPSRCRNDSVATARDEVGDE